ncbi:hypothetical protein [Terriglobus sp. ADX1]|uniref:hypothetical protein n=1 Tax=Terriglobus sp. ADX1 TaxID=2794063 RepID=UPI002FE51299
MAIALNTKLAEGVQKAAAEAGLVVVNGQESAGFNGIPTEKYTLALVSAPEGHTFTLELSAGFDITAANIAPSVRAYLLESAKRLTNPRPDVFVTLGGLPVSLTNWQWPFHLSVSGADTYVVHGGAALEDGKTAADQLLKAKVSASMTVTFAEVVAAPEQPFAEGFIYNAVRKILDQGQMELTKSGGNRQVVPVTTRYYSAKQGKFIFNDTTAQQRADYLLSKVYWLSGVLGNGAPVWIADPRDAQYLNTSVEELKKTAESLAGEGILKLDPKFEYASSTEPLMAHHAEYEHHLQDALEFTRPTFNEEMRSGHTNM